MQAGRAMVRVQSEESVAAVYARDFEAMPDALFLRVGGLHLMGPPAHVVAVLENALHECLKAWASGYADADAESQDVAPRYGNAGLRPAWARSPWVSDRAPLLQLSQERCESIADVPGGPDADRA